MILKRFLSTWETVFGFTISSAFSSSYLAFQGTITGSKLTSGTSIIILLHRYHIICFEFLWFGLSFVINHYFCFREACKWIFTIGFAMSIIMQWVLTLNLSKRVCYAMLCYAKSLQSCPTLWDPRDGSPPGSPVPGILQARTLEWAAISFSNAWKWKVKVKSLSHVRLLATPWIAA